MGGNDTNIAAAALAIALVAVVTTLGQLLQQYFATADGHRRCQPSVMGAWAQKTRLNWRWKEFRFETLYTTPEISMQWSSGHWISDNPLLTRPDIFRTEIRVPVEVEPSSNTSHEMVCWLELLNSIQALTHSEAD